MWLGMNAGEWGLCAFIFILVYSAGFVGRVGEVLGEKLGGGKSRE